MRALLVLTLALGCSGAASIDASVGGDGAFDGGPGRAPTFDAHRPGADAGCAPMSLITMYTPSGARTFEARDGDGAPRWFQAGFGLIGPPPEGLDAGPITPETDAGDGDAGAPAPTTGLGVLYVASGSALYAIPTVGAPVATYVTELADADGTPLVPSILFSDVRTVGGMFGAELRFVRRATYDFGAPTIPRRLDLEDAPVPFRPRGLALSVPPTTPLLFALTEARTILVASPPFGEGVFGASFPVGLCVDPPGARFEELTQAATPEAPRGAIPQLVARTIEADGVHALRTQTGACMGAPRPLTRQGGAAVERPRFLVPVDTDRDGLANLVVVEDACAP